MSLDDFIDISQYAEESRLEAFVSGTSNYNFVNYMVDCGVSPLLIQKFKTTYAVVAVIKLLHISEGYRGQGVGMMMLHDVINDAYLSNAEAIVSIANTDEDNLFDIEEWYVRQGFKTVAHIDQNPLMLKEF